MAHLISCAHNSGLTVNVHQPGALADAMERFCTEPELGKPLARRALANAAERTWDKVLRELWHDDDCESPPASEEADRRNERAAFASDLAINVA